jgi:hypothetical protein
VTLDRVKQVVRFYEKVALREVGSAPFATGWQSKIIEMAPRLIMFCDEGRTEKAMRWLGFMQGLLWWNETFTLAELEAHNNMDVPAPEVAA